MPIDDEQVRLRVWAETASLASATDGDGDTHVLDRTVAAVAIMCDGDGFAVSKGGAALQDDEKARWAAIGEDIAALRSGQVAPTALNAVLCEVDARDDILRPDALPDAANWAADETKRSVAGRYKPRKEGDTARYALFVPKRVAITGPASFVSTLTGTGMPGPRPTHRWLPWAFGIAAFLVFVIAAMTIHSTGRQIAWSLQLMKGQQIGFEGKPADASKGPACLETFAKLSSSAKPSAAADKPPTSNEISACEGLWSRAMAFAAANRLRLVPDWIFNSGMPDPSIPSAMLRFSIGVPMAIMMVCVLVLSAALGYGTSRTPWGIVVNDRNRLSLALVQASAWTVLILPAIVAYASFNAGLEGDALRIAAKAVMAKKDNGALPDFGMVPRLPGEVWAALGIAFGSTMLSSVILQGKSTGQGTLAAISGTGRGQPNVATNSALPAKRSPRDANLSDLFLGEEAGNLGQVDISRLQMVVITVGLLIVYAQLLFGQSVDLSLADIVVDYGRGASLLGAFPDAGATFVALMAVSHATYIATKVTDKPVSPTNTAPVDGH